MVNLFLVDWQEGDWENLSFPDVFEYLYTRKTGELAFDWTKYTDPRNRTRAMIPTALFAHEVTIRPLADGGFQYVGNQVTEVGQWGLPYNQPRFTLDDFKSPE